MSEFDFEKLDVFKVSVDMVLCVDGIASTLPKGRSYMRDQLHRSSNSVSSMPSRHEAYFFASSPC